MKLRATAVGFTAILMWSFLALLTAASGRMPPFQLSAICFAIGSIPGILVLILNPSRLALLKQPARVWVTTRAISCWMGPPTTHTSPSGHA